jgi:hypothetical protein
MLKLILMSVFCRRALEELICGHFDVMNACVSLREIRVAVPCLERKLSMQEIKTFLSVL